MCFCASSDIAVLAATTIDLSKMVSLRLGNLVRVVYDDLGFPFIELNFACHAHALSLKRDFWLSEFCSVDSKDDHCERLLWIGLVQIEECRLGLRFGGVFGGS